VVKARGGRLPKPANDTISADAEMLPVAPGAVVDGAEGIDADGSMPGADDVV